MGIPNPIRLQTYPKNHYKNLTERLRKLQAYLNILLYQQEICQHIVVYVFRSGESRSTERENGFYDFLIMSLIGANCLARMQPPFRLSQLALFGSRSSAYDETLRYCGDLSPVAKAISVLYAHDRIAFSSELVDPA